MGSIIESGPTMVCTQSNNLKQKLDQDVKASCFLRENTQTVPFNPGGAQYPLFVNSN